MNTEQLEKILDKHAKWLKTEGKKGERADLSGAILSDAILCGANLNGANLRGANLRDANLRGANLCDADLRDADLRGADLRDADLSDADLRDANLDLSAFPLWCGGLEVHIDDRQAIQLLYHLMSNVLYSKNTSQAMKNLCSQKALVDKANEFRRVNECGRIVGGNNDDDQ